MNKPTRNNEAKALETIYFLLGAIPAYIIEKLIKGGRIPEQIDIIHVLLTIVLLSMAIILLITKVTKNEICRFGFVYLSFVFSFGWSLGVSFTFIF